MKRIVFTGQAMDAEGNVILRADLIEAAQAIGLTVYKNWEPGVDILVASRDDTMKAKRAQKSGTPVWSYPRFIEFLGDNGMIPVWVEVDDNTYTPDFYADPIAYQETHKTEPVKDVASYKWGNEL